MGSVSGCSELGSLHVSLDGTELAWPSHPLSVDSLEEATSDRQMYSFGDDMVGFTAGDHFITFTSDAASHAWQLCSVQVLEFGTDEEFKRDPGYVGAYPMWDKCGHEFYRPTANLCCMRAMQSSELCPVCKERVWHRLLRRVSLIDAVTVERGTETVTFSVKVIPLAQLRIHSLQDISEQLEVVWEKRGKGGIRRSGLFSFVLPSTDAAGSWVVTVTYRTTEVRLNPKGVLTSTQHFKV